MSTIHKTFSLEENTIKLLDLVRTKLNVSQSDAIEYGIKLLDEATTSNNNHPNPVLAFAGILKEAPKDVFGDMKRDRSSNRFDTLD